MGLASVKAVHSDACLMVPAIRGTVAHLLDVDAYSLSSHYQSNSLPVSQTSENNMV